MKIDRRSFLSLGIGASAGVALSPLPWKLTDDLSIWTQMWPWTPVPADGDANYVNSVCTLCPGGCGITVRKIDNRAVKIEGQDGHPVNDGGICILGLSGLQLLYGPTRVKGPMKRVGARGEGKWKKISWDEAISEVTTKLTELRKKGAPEKLACISGSDRGTVPSLLKRFLDVYGSPNFFRMPSMQDSSEMALKLMHGFDAIAGYDLENTDLVLSFGSGLIDGWGSPVRMFKANANWKSGKGKVIQIEPRLSNTAAKADRWITINPGTESYLAMGLAQVIIKEALYNKDFIEIYSFGFEDWTDDAGKERKGFKSIILSEAFAPSRVAEVTGVPSKMVTELARTCAKAKKPLALCGRGRGSASGSLHEFAAVHALNALVGNINKEGGVWALPEPDYIKWSDIATDDIALKGLKTERIDGAGGKEYPYAKSIISNLIKKSDKESPLDALIVSGANPYYSLPDSGAVKKALDKIQYIVSFSSYMDETAEQADIILPNHVYLERYEDVPAPVGLHKPMLSVTRPVVEPLFNTKNTGDAILLIAKAMGDSFAASFPWAGYEECLEKTIGSMWSKVVEDGFLNDPDYTASPWKSAFKTATGKFEFLSGSYEHKGDAKVSVAEPEGGKGYDLILIPVDSIRLASGYVGNTPFMTKTVGDDVLKKKDGFVEINPETAGKLGLKEGAYATLTTPKGSKKVRVHLFNGIKPGLVAMPRGLGHTAYDNYLADKGVNVNELIGPVEEPSSGLDSAWGIKAKLAKA